MDILHILWIAFSLPVFWAVMYMAWNSHGYISPNIIIFSILGTVLLTFLVPLGFCAILVALGIMCNDSSSWVNRRYLRK